jgi:hypothetical protein
MFARTDLSRFATSESGSISSKSSNSKLEATEQPTNTVSEIGSATCHIPAGTTLQNVLVSTDNVTV